SAAPPHPDLLLLAVARLARTRLSFARPAAHRRRAFVLRNAQLVGLQPSYLVAQSSRFLEFEIGGRLAHPAFQILDIGAQIVADEVRPLLVAGVDDEAVAIGDMGQYVGDVALDRGRRDAVRFIIFALLFAAPVGFAK